jgi:hypothetical protein
MFRKKKRNKLQSKSQPSMFLGYLDESKAYRIWNKTTRKVCITRDVIFHEGTTSTTTTVPAKSYAQLLLQVDSSNSTVLVSLPTPATSIHDTHGEQCRDLSLSQSMEQDPDTSTSSAPPAQPQSRLIPQSTTPIDTSIPITRPQRICRPVQHYGD